MREASRCSCAPSPPWGRGEGRGEADLSACRKWTMLFQTDWAGDIRRGADLRRGSDNSRQLTSWGDKCCLAPASDGGRSTGMRKKIVLTPHGPPYNLHCWKHSPARANVIESWALERDLEPVLPPAIFGIWKKLFQIMRNTWNLRSP